MNWVSITDRTKCVDVQGTFVTVYFLTRKDVVLIDSGGAESPEFLLDLKQKGLSVLAILYTHLHLDHTGNLYTLLENYNPQVYVSQRELSAWFFEDFYGKKPFIANPIQDEEKKLLINGETFGIIQTYGHSEGHLAFVTPDDVCCIGDVLMSENLLRVAKIPYMADADRAVESMELLRNTQFLFYVLAHKAVITRKELDHQISENVKKELLLYEILRSQVTRAMAVNELVDVFMCAVQIHNEAIFKHKAYRLSVESRISTLASTGVATIREGIVYPSTFAPLATLSLSTKQVDLLCDNE